MNPKPDPSAYKYRDPHPPRDAGVFSRPNPMRHKRHEPTECLEVYGPEFRRLYMCSVCGEGYELDPESRAVGVSCCGDAMLEACEG